MVLKRYSEFGGSRSSFTTVGVADVQVVRPNSNRRKLIIINNAANNIYLVKGDGPAAVNSGITLLPGGSWIIVPDTLGYIWKGEIHAISGVAAQNLTWTEDW